MTNSLPVPEYLKNRGASGITSAMSEGLGGMPFSRISRNGNRFTFVTTDGQSVPHNKLYLDVVIVDVNAAISRTYYENRYSAGGENSPPVCFSDDGIRPSSRSSKPQNDICGQSCPRGRFQSCISAKTGLPSKRSECVNQKKIAVLVPELDNDMVFQFTIPPGSLKNCANYARTVSSTSLGHRPAELSDVVTRISFSTEGAGIIEFQPVGFVPERILKVIDELKKTDLTAIIVGRKETGATTIEHVAAPMLKAPIENDIPGYGHMGHNNPPEPIDEIPEHSPPKPSTPVAYGMAKGSTVPKDLKASLQKNFGSPNLEAAMNLPTKE